jgi:hypothetical protein
VVNDCGLGIVARSGGLGSGLREGGEGERIKELASWPLSPLMSLYKIVIFKMS